MCEFDLVEAARSALAELVPYGVSAHVELVSGEFPVKVEESSHLVSAVSSRIDEFNTGRHCLREGLSTFGLSDVLLLADEDGVPQLPVGYLGSISHSRGLCVAVAGADSKFAYLGVDVEKTNRLSDTAAKRVVHVTEEAWVAGDQQKASLLFSAKEAFYKAQFPKWRCAGNFHDLILEVDELAETARAVKLMGAFPLELSERMADLRFAYHYVKDYIICVCWMPVGAQAFE